MATGIQLPEGVTFEQLEACMRDWGMPANEYNQSMAALWFSMVSAESYYAVSFKIPYVIGDSTGIFLFLSTAESSRVFKDNMVAVDQGRIITQPFWFKFAVYQFQNMALLNLASFQDTRYQGHQPSPDLESFFDTKVFTKNPQWRNQYCLVSGGGYLFDSLRNVMVHGMHANVWVELTVGRSWRAYGGLDVYLRIMATSMRPPLEEAWYILNDTTAFGYRNLPAPEDWWMYHDYRAVGQREVIGDFYLKVFGGALVKRPLNHLVDMPPGVFQTLPVYLQEQIQRRHLNRPRL